MAIVPGTAAPTIHRLLHADADPATRLIGASAVDLAGRIGCTRRGAGRAIERLLAAGHLELARRGEGPGRPAVYRVLTAPDADALGAVATLATETGR